MNLLRNFEGRIAKKNREYVLQLEIIEVALVHYNLINNQCEQSLTVLNTFTLNKSFWNVNKFSASLFILLNTFKYSKAVELEDRINLTLVIRWDIKSNQEIEFMSKFKFKW